VQKLLFFSRIIFFIIIANSLNSVAANEIKCPLNRIILSDQFSILEDPTRSLTIEQVNKPHYASQFKANDNAQTNFGISHSAFWFRIKPMMPPDCTQDWLLAIRWPLLDSINFYWHTNSHWESITTGAKYPYSSRQIDFHTYMFRLPDLSAEHPAYFVRVAGDNPLFMGMRLLQQQRFVANTDRRSILQGVYLGVLIGLILYNLFVFLSLRDSAYLYYVIYLISTVLLVAQYSGIATRYLWSTTPNWNLLAFWVFILTGTIAYLSFIRKFLNTKKRTPRLNRAIIGFSIMLMIVVSSFYYLNHAIMIAVTPILALIGFSLSGMTIFIAIKEHYRPAHFVGLANIIFIVGMIWASLLMFGYPRKLLEWNYFVFIFGIVIEATLLSLALASKIKLLQQEKLSAQQALLESRDEFPGQLLAAQDTERKRIASELHDGIGQNLMVVNNRLNRVLKANPPLDLSKQLNFVHSITQQTIDDLRGLSHRLHPHQLDRLGLATAIKTMAIETLRDGGIRLTCQIDAIDALVNKNQSLHIYRIAQEAMNNIIHHAKADKVIISLRHDKQTIYLNIFDNGRGISALWFDQKDYSQAFGLSSIKERVQLMSGTFDIFHAAPSGLALEIKVPLQHEKTV
jgi:signal transduction histidine kinase